MLKRINKFETENWKLFLELAKKAADQSVGVRGKLSALFWRRSTINLMCPFYPELTTEHFGFNHMPFKLKEPLEYVADGGDGKPYFPKTVEEVQQYSYDELVSKPDVIHAEIHAMAKFLTHDNDSSGIISLFVSQTPCPNCARKLIKNVPQLETIVVQKAYRQIEGLKILIEKMEFLCEVAFIEDDYSLTIFDVTHENSFLEIEKYLKERVL